MAYPIQVNAQNGNTVYVGSPGGGNYKLNLSECATTSINLPSGQWGQISLPCALPSNAKTVQAVFGDDINGQYGTDWIVFSYDAVSNRYTRVEQHQVLTQGVGYWILHLNDSTAVLDLPPSSADITTSQTNQCANTERCYSIPLATRQDRVQWNMLGHTLLTNTVLDQLRIVTSSGQCAIGCTLDQAKIDNIVENTLWHFKDDSFEDFQGEALLHPWNGFWIAVHTGANGLNPKLEIPIN
jgi:hypothetical protein